MPSHAVRKAQEVCTLGRRELRAMGLTSRGVLRLYEEARERSLAEGCTCGVVGITPVPRPDGNYSVQVYHEPGCGAHPLLAKRRVLRARRWWRRKRLRWRGRWDRLVLHRRKLRLS